MYYTTKNAMGIFAVYSIFCSLKSVCIESLLFFAYIMIVTIIVLTKSCPQTKGETTGYEKLDTNKNSLGATI